MVLCDSPTSLTIQLFFNCFVVHTLPRVGNVAQKLFAPCASRASSPAVGSPPHFQHIRCSSIHFHGRGFADLQLEGWLLRRGMGEWGLCLPGH